MKHLFLRLILILWSNAYCMAQLKPENPIRRTPDEINSSVKSISLVDAKVPVLPKNGFNDAIFAPSRKYKPNATNAIVFYEDFDGIVGSTAGGVGTYAFPTGWLLRNVDNKTPNATVGYVNDAWERREDFRDNNTADSVAFSTSWYNPAGQADDWMWTPLISIPMFAIHTSSVLKWNAVSYDAENSDGYEVRVMTVAPTGGNGVLGNQVSASTQIFSVTAENTVWTPHQVSLAAYAGQSIYIGFRNNSNDKFLLAIDDVLVENTPIIDAKLSWIVRPSPYSFIPLSQSSAFAFGGQIENAGLNAINNVAFKTKVKVGQDAVGTFTSNATATIAPGSFYFNMFFPFTPTSRGIYEIKTYPSLNEIDTESANDTITTTIEVTSDFYTRSNGFFTGALGIGAGVEALFGSLYTITNTVELKSVKVAFNALGATPAYTTKVRIYGTTAQGIPNNLPPIWESAPITYTETKPTIKTFEGSTIILPPGTYWFGCVEIDNTIAVLYSDDIFTPKTNFIRWATSPFGDVWTATEEFGLPFAKSFFIAPVLNCSTNITQTANITSGIVEKIATNTISASNQISNAKVEYIASKAIFLDPGFKTEGNKFTAQIGGCENAIPGLVAYYPFNGNANDESTNNNNGVVNGATLTTDRFGDANKAYAFDGVDDRINANVGAEMYSAEKTISVWAMVSGAGSFNPRLVGVGPHGSSLQYYSLLLEGLTSPRRLWFFTYNAVSQAYSNTLVQNSSLWNHYTVTYNGSAVKIYINGILDSETAVTGSLNNFSSALLQIGYSDNGLDWFDGKLDDIRIYNRAISDAEILALYNAEKP